MRFARDLAPFLAPHRALFIGMSLSLLVDAAFQTALPLLLRSLIDRAIVPQDRELMLMLIGALAVAVVVLSMVMGWRDHLYARLGAAVIRGVRQRLFDHLQTLSLAFFQRTPGGELMARFSTDLASVESVVVGAVPNTLTAVLSLVFLSATLFVLDPQLAALTLLVVPATWLGPRWLLPRAADAGDHARASEAAVLGAVHENIATQATVKSMGLEARSREQFRQRLQALESVSLRFNFLCYFSERAPNIGVLVVYVLVLACAAQFAFERSISVGTLVAFGALFQGLSAAIAQLTSNLPVALQASAGMRRIQALLDEKPAVVNRMDAPPLRVASHRLTMEHVGLRIEGRVVLQDVSLAIDEGQTVALVGPSGSGKSTVLSLLARLQDPSVGNVRIGGTALPGASLASLRERMSLVLQDSVLFEASVRDNLRAGCPQATDEDLRVAARQAQADSFILQLPDGYDTLLGPRGEKLSGGQRQRIAIARALLRRTPLLLLDEPTSALDPVSERAVSAELVRSRTGRTTVLVTHNLEQARSCDCIFVLDQGQLVESGTHHALMRDDGLYAQMWRRQQGVQVSDDLEHATVTPEWLSELPLLEGMDASALADLADDFEIERASAGRTVIRQGAPGDRFYVIAHGSVSVRRQAGSEGTGYELARLNVGDAFGERALLSDAPRNATVRTLSDCVFLTLERSRFRRWLERDAALLQRVNQLLAAR